MLEGDALHLPNISFILTIRLGIPVLCQFSSYYAKEGLSCQNFCSAL